MSSTFYTGGRVRPIQLQDYADVVEAAAAGSLDETQWVELKEMLPPAKSENLEVAKDLASLAVGGGVLLVGVRDAQGSAGEVVGTKLGRLADRVSQVAVTRIDPPLNVVVREVPDPEHDGYGVLVVTVPASLSAPHMVDGAYWGRHARGKRKMSDGEVRLLHHEGERRAASFVQDLQALPADLCTVTDSNRRLAHLYLLMRPEVSVGTALADAIADGRSFRSFVDDGLRFNPRYLPTLDGAERSVPNPDGWELSTGTDAEDWALRAVLGTDGSLAVYSGHLSYETDSDHERRRYISPGTAIELTHSALEVAGHIGARVLHYQGTWQIGVLADGLLGLPSMLARSAFRTRIAAYPRDRFDNVIQATTDDLLDRTREVVGELLRPFMRGMGAEFLLEYPSADKIGDQLGR
jgi:hypothetical protein